MALSIPGRVVVFDYGEVISLSPSESDMAAVLSISGCDAGSFWAAYWQHRDPLDQGTISVAEYWALLARDLGTGWSVSTVYELWVADFRGWLSVNTGTVDLIAQLHSGGTRLAILSNAGFDFAGPFRFSPIGSYWERVFVSAEMDAVKPAPAIYLEVADELGITPAEMVFIDNKSVNTDAASALGITTHHFTDAEGLGAFLRLLAI